MFRQKTLWVEDGLSAIMGIELDQLMGKNWEDVPGNVVDGMWPDSSSLAHIRWRMEGPQARVRALAMRK
jgi:hypothetical protein